LRHRLRLGRSTDPPPLLPTFVFQRFIHCAGEKVCASAPSNICALSTPHFFHFQRTSKSIRGFNGSLIAIYLQSKIPAPHQGGYAARAYRHPSPAGESFKLKALAVPECLPGRRAGTSPG
jgi:hypothetical protein